MNIVVTGASGFIGRTFLHRFAASEGVSLYGVGRQHINDFPRSVKYSATALDKLELPDFIPDVVIHAAGRASPWATANAYYRDNVETTQHVLDFCQRNGFPRLIFISSAAVYYRFEHQFALQEQQPVGPSFTSQYGSSKYDAEKRVAGYQGEKTLLRPCGVFGPGDNVLFPPLITAAKNKQLVRLTSGDIPAQAEIMHVDTLCDYLMRAATFSPVRPCYNLSGGYSVETWALLTDVLQQLGLPLPEKTMSIKNALRVAGIVERLWRWFPLSGQPPVTRFGIGVFGYSSTLDITAMLEDFGPPSEDLRQSLHRFLQACKATAL